ncbi:hypothetical protein BamMEX5DRAFT_6232 [Burkholderia ambifaria MEX-5]|uniref:Transposase InsH N-terminal domain-containing protein n=1 Tax=Burkholderia ambifaria MEX-5 TaxID=396597 RepID=B1TEL6_9BURK|nr:hypothetical protein BamMEX5DRAFT_6232 [Burkholderia ambifaria MEX-5]
MSFAEAESAGKKRVTRRQRFLDEMEKLVPWSRLLTAIEPYYPKGERGRPPIGLERMLRIYFLQQWYSLSDEGLDDALYDSIAMRAFAGIDLAVENVPDATTLLKFRRLLLEHDLTRKLFDEIGISLCERGLMMKEGTLVDATIIEAPSSTKNAEKRRDPDMHQTKKGVPRSPHCLNSQPRSGATPRNARRAANRRSKASRCFAARRSACCGFRSNAAASAARWSSCSTRSRRSPPPIRTSRTRCASTTT